MSDSDTPTIQSTSSDCESDSSLRLMSKKPFRKIDPNSSLSCEQLMEYRLSELQALARNCNIVYTGANKDTLSHKLAEHLSVPYKYKNTIVITSHRFT
ncbi:hypothetical protein TetV_661 [Tetraselmis virus 1]|uniref:SAP domain-containing protein n=1 Tax=Tetraselmis virus 1 TaxID=2060617 RepID=A0A2P0VPB6_9VIRU|nr:hypothetical protein QJ968_gp393 [Tetraselmis virus 1]AUF82743.1 hypothetical protein TetV_661 [Tetraselmis virus 1]